MADEKPAARPKETNTVIRDVKPGGSQAEKSKGKGDDAINQTQERGRQTESAKNQPTQDPPDDGGFTDR
jgi:hypothetical protein